MTHADEHARTTAHAQHARETDNAPVRRLVSELLGGRQEAILEHEGQDYRLRITRNGKLILTK